MLLLARIQPPQDVEPEVPPICHWPAAATLQQAEARVPGRALMVTVLARRPLQPPQLWLEGVGVVGSEMPWPLAWTQLPQALLQLDKRADAITTTVVTLGLSSRRPRREASLILASMKLQSQSRYPVVPKAVATLLGQMTMWS